MGCVKSLTGSFYILPRYKMFTDNSALANYPGAGTIYQTIKIIINPLRNLMPGSPGTDYQPVSCHACLLKRFFRRSRHHTVSIHQSAVYIKEQNLSHSSESLPLQIFLKECLHVGSCLFFVFSFCRYRNGLTLLYSKTHNCHKLLCFRSFSALGDGNSGCVFLCLFSKYPCRTGMDSYFIGNCVSS